MCDSDIAQLPTLNNNRFFFFNRDKIHISEPFVVDSSVAFCAFTMQRTIIFSYRTLSSPDGFTSGI